MGICNNLPKKKLQWHIMVLLTTCKVSGCITMIVMASGTSMGEEREVLSITESSIHGHYKAGWTTGCTKACRDLCWQHFLFVNHKLLKYQISDPSELMLVLRYFPLQVAQKHFYTPTIHHFTHVQKTVHQLTLMKFSIPISDYSFYGELLGH